MVLVAPKLSGAAVCAQLLKYLAKCQMDDVSAIRVNTNICLGKIAPHLEPGVRQCVCVSLHFNVACTRSVCTPACTDSSESCTKGVYREFSVYALGCMLHV